MNGIGSICLAHAQTIERICDHCDSARLARLEAKVNKIVDLLEAINQKLPPPAEQQIDKAKAALNEALKALGETQ